MHVLAPPTVLWTLNIGNCFNSLWCCQWAGWPIRLFHPACPHGKLWWLTLNNAVQEMICGEREKKLKKLSIPRLKFGQGRIARCGWSMHIYIDLHQELTPSLSQPVKFTAQILHTPAGGGGGGEEGGCVCVCVDKPQQYESMAMSNKIVVKEISV